MFWNGFYYFDKVPPFGLRSASFIFNQLSDAIEGILQHNYMISFVCHILDDFFIIESPAPTVSLHSLFHASLSTMILSFKNLNISIWAAKTGPCKVLQFMGIILDSHKMEARLSVDKVEWIKTALWEFRSKQSMTLQEFQSLLLGVIPLGCPFLQRKIALIRGVKNPITTLSSQQVFSKTSICGACLLSNGMV